ncbi:MAG: S8 family serine peptidase, partial [Acidobacteriota bacterium]|nr:S8 family serine peptidase [Acidobacteriota bacterium]
FPSGLDPTAYAATGVGDILLLEVQRALLPTEVDEADLDAIRLATALGVTVVEAAGNGGQDLDRYQHPVTGRALNRQSSAFVDSGAVMVGAAFAALPHNRAPFSNFGTRLDCFGWGESVTSCGYGDLDGGDEPTKAYTNTFSGTSSAAPMIAGAAALLQGMHRRQTGNSLAPLPLRALLADPATGTPQGPNVAGFIGVMPDLEALVQDHLQLAPHLYLRKQPCDDGSTAGENAILGSCPDIIVFRNPIVDSASQAEQQKTIDQLRGTLMEESQTANDPAPGWRVRHAQSNWLFLRMRNRGLGMATTSATFFWSPAATFIPPERWCEVGSAQPKAVQQGDRLTVMQHVAWNPAPSPPTAEPDSIWDTSDATPPHPNPTHNCSLLAVLHPALEPPVDAHTWPPQHSAPHIPPSGSYFDWAAYREFLRRPDVGWRNIYQVLAGKPIRRLAFYIAGTPDRERHFDLEVLQRLPKDAKVRLKLNAGLASKLRQRQPLLAGASPTTLELLQRPRVRFSRLCLAAGLYAPALLEVEAPAGSILYGHSVAIRQLWRGEEVGRVTWFFKS